MTQVKCEVQGVFVAFNDATTVPLVILADGDGRVLPIFIGIWEAVSINSAKIKEVLPRPFTHDLFIDLCAKFSITLRSLQIDSIDNGVYYAQLVLVSDHHRGVPRLPAERRDRPCPQGGYPYFCR